MYRKLLFSLVFSLCAGSFLPVQAQSVLKEKLPPTIYKYLITAAPEFATMVKAINAVRLDETFSGPGPVTMFAPTNKAFEGLPAGTVDSWLQPDMSDSLQKILTYHVIAGSWTVSELEQKIRESGGEFFIPTIGEGGKLSFVLENNKVLVKDVHGFKTILGIPSKEQNGLVYSMDKLLLP